jgi:hypothetical protein
VLAYAQPEYRPTVGGNVQISYKECL